MQDNTKEYPNVDDRCRDAVERLLVKAGREKEYHKTFYEEILNSRFRAKNFAVENLQQTCQVRDRKSFHPRQFRDTLHPLSSTTSIVCPRPH
jgi:hypothetical protein